MADPLDRAVDASMAAHTPDRVPPFEQVQARKKARDRRLGGAALAATALAVAGVAFVPTALIGSGVADSAPGQVAQDGTATTLTGGDLPCETSRSFIYGLATSTGGAPTPEEAAKRFGARPGAEPGYAGQTWRRAATNPNGEVVVQGQTARLTVLEGSDGTWLVTGGSACPQVTTQPMHSMYTVQPARRAPLVAGLEEERDACFALPGVEAVGQGESAPVTYRVKVLAGQAEPFERCITAVLGLYVPELDPKGGPPETDGTRYGVGVGWGDDPASYDKAAEAAVQRCFSETGLKELSTLTSLPPSHSGKITGRGAADALKACVAEGAPGATVFLTPLSTAAQQAFIEECLGGNYRTALPAPGLLGRTYEDVAPPNEKPVNVVRVVGQDGRCRDREDDRQDKRVNVIIENGVVIWAGRF